MKSNFKILPIARFIFLWGPLCFVLSGCVKSVTYNFSVEAPKAEIKREIEKINIFLETSVSMKGYVNANKPGDYVLKDVLPYLIIDLDNNYKDLTTLYTVTDKPKKVNENRQKFLQQLRSGDIFGGGSSPFQDVFAAVIDSVGDASISIMISDCISDLGKVNTMSEGSKVSQAIYTHLSKKEDIGVAVFQYNSDFNGAYYYDRENTGGRNQSARPYNNTILKNRPFYIWVLGNKNLVNQLLEKDMFKGYVQSHFFNLPLDDINAHVLANPKKGKVSINEEKQTVMIQEASPKRPVEFVIGVDLKNKPKYYSTLFSDPGHFKIEPDFLKDEIKLETMDLASILSGKNVNKSFIDENALSNFLRINMIDIDPNLDGFSISLPSIGASWFDTVHLDDDLGLPSEELEGKTFAFKYITDGFDRYFKDEGPLLKFNFLKTQKP